jgi:hypothetical protein
MMIGAAGSVGSRKWKDRRRKMGVACEQFRPARNVEHTPPRSAPYSLSYLKTEMVSCISDGLDSGLDAIE